MKTLEKMTDDTKHTRSFAMIILYAKTKITFELYANMITFAFYECTKVFRGVRTIRAP